MVANDNDYEWVYTDEPHSTRRALILAKYPQIKQLMKADPQFKWKVLSLVFIQFVSFYWIKNITNFWHLLLLSYGFGGVINTSLTISVHELVHNNGFGVSRPLANKVLAFIVNLPIGVPMFGSMKKYHSLHHRYQGDDIYDTDVPSQFEVNFFSTTFTKIIWMVLQPLFYIARPFVKQPAFVVNPTSLELYNILVQLLFNYLVVQWFGWHTVCYMLGSTFISMGLHPMAGHILSEHFCIITDKIILKPNQPKELLDLVPETFSYYGPFNVLMHNVGYHVEHHDFPSIPGSLLPKVRQIAPEYYDYLPSHSSWTYVIWKFITDPKVGPYSRVKRPHRYEKQIQQKSNDFVNEVNSEFQ